MSRIHEALLRAQKECGVENKVLDVETLSIAEASVGDSGPTDVSESSAISEPPESEVSDETRAFPHCAWNPDKRRLVFIGPKSSPGVEEFRILRSKLLSQRNQRFLKTILVNSATPAEGKTFVTANLALAMARHSGSRVLLIDGDLRRSRVHSIFGISRSPGLSEYLSGLVGEEAIVRQTPEPQLCIVTSGKTSEVATELLHSSGMQEFVQRMSRIFDWIFIDSPPGMTVSDGVVLAEISDAVIMVVAAGTDVQVAQQCRKQLGQKLLGVVLNRTEKTESYCNYYFGGRSMDPRDNGEGETRGKGEEISLNKS